MFSSVPARRCDRVSQDPSHDGADKRGVDEGDAVEVRLVPEFEGWRLLGVYALCVCVDSTERRRPSLVDGLVDGAM